MTPRRMVQHLASIMNHPLSRDAPLAAVGRFARWQIGSRFLRAPAIVPFTDQARLIVSTGMTGATCNIYTGLHDLPEMAFTVHLLRPDDAFVDVGANVGVYTVLAGAVAGARCTAFEPSVRIFKALRENVRINNIDADLRREAVGASCGTVKFSEDRLDTTSHVAQLGESGVDVQLVNLDGVLSETPTLIKIDVEGFESAVLDGAEKILADPKLLAVIMETNGSGERYGAGDDVLLSRMTAYGFRAYSYSPFERRLISPGTNKNTILIRNEMLVADRLKTAPSFSVRGREI